MLPISDLTYKVVAYQTISDFNTDEFVDWALEMMELGQVSENLFILAGLIKPTNFFEACAYLNKALTELGLRVKIGHDGIISYSYYYVRIIAKRINIKHNLEDLNTYVINCGYDKSIFDFYLLYWAWNALDYDGEQGYWAGATSENIEHLVVDRARSWLIEYELQCIQTVLK